MFVKKYVYVIYMFGNIVRPLNEFYDIKKIEIDRALLDAFLEQNPEIPNHELAIEEQKIRNMYKISIYMPPSEIPILHTYKQPDKKMYDYKSFLDDEHYEQFVKQYTKYRKLYSYLNSLYIDAREAYTEIAKYFRGRRNYDYRLPHEQFVKNPNFGNVIIAWNDYVDKRNKYFNEVKQYLEIEKSLNVPIGLYLANVNYHNKYLKYKTKYINLLNKNDR